MSNEQPLIIDLLQRVKTIAGKSVPEGKLENRLLNLGLEEFIRNPAKEADKTLRKYGFPFKFSGQLDEVILVLAHFLDRFRDEGGTLNVYVLNNLSNGDDASLSYWQSSKAKLYLELQNLILQLDGLKWPETKDLKEGESQCTWTSNVTRIFTFRKMVDIAYLTQPAISAMIEQLATGMKIGFLFSETFNPQSHNGYSRRKPGNLFPNSMVVEFIPERSKRIHDVFILQDQTDSNYLPYQERCKAKWFTNLDKAKREEKTLKAFLTLFNAENWKRFWEEESESAVCRFEDRGTEYFNQAAVMLYESFTTSKIAKEMRDEEENPDQYIVQKINGSVIPDDFMEIQRTMSVFDEAEDIWAVDASSTKKSLKVHESSPTYRQWIRKSLNRALNPKQVLKTQGKSLNRIYILKDTHDEKDIEFTSLQRILQYYFDYFRYDISEMDSVVRVQPTSLAPPPKEPLPWLADYWESLKDRVHIHITTSSVLKHVTDHIDPVMLAKILSDVFSPASVSPDDVHSYLIRLDYLFTRKMIYNYRNPRATPTEGREEAFIYRSAGPDNLAAESNILFKFGEGLNVFTELQKKYRMLSLLKVLEKYEDRHFDSCQEFKDVVDEQRPQLEKIKAKLTTDAPIAVGESEDLLKIRLNYESTLHWHFKPKFDFLHRLLETFSVEVRFFDDASKELIRDVYPFDKTRTVTAVSNKIKKVIKTRRNRIQALNDELSSLLHAGKEAKVEKPSIFLSYARKDQEKVLKIFQRLQSEGFEPWLDQKSILPGRNWPVAIKRAVKSSQFFIACLSNNSVNRRGYVQRELKQALDIWRGKLTNDIYLIPVRLDKCEVPEELAEQFQSVDLFVNDNWSDEGWELFLAALKQGLEEQDP
jgi:hypothetical protein